ncbi:MAG: hypothetical protein EP330_28460 [Deltaproteobacteria bacterium]|nr:MAG: hypothetical protein EP330_28460 [Deltaproteobacteria bacterium]
MRHIAVLMPDTGRSPTVGPNEWPLGRGALRAWEHGVGVIFGERVDEQGRLIGIVATPEGWREARVRPQALFDRFRDQLHPERYATARAALSVERWFNHPDVLALCRDKLASQRALEAAGIPMPEVVDDDFESQLAEWGSGFLKPRYGSFGRGVRRVVPGDLLPMRSAGMHADDLQQMVLQRAVPPPEAHAGVSVRALVQRVDGAWRSRTPVARISDDEPVVNVARGARVGPAAEVLGAGIDRRLREVAEAVGEVVHRWGAAVEVGVDLVVDPAGSVSVIEVNGRPRGRLASLAALSDAFRDEHVAACAAPLLAAAE